MKFPVSPSTETALKKWMLELGIKEEDIEEKFIKGSGHGGQKINKTSSTVYLFHSISGIEVKCQHGRSQSLNRYYARKKLCKKLEEALLGKLSQEQQTREKIRRQKRKRSKRQKEKMLQNKKLRSTLKAGRKPISSDES